MIFNSNVRIKRGGRKYRRQSDRYIYIKHHGWFVLTRDDLEICDGLELHNGIRGPFATQSSARCYLQDMISLEQT